MVGLVAVAIIIAIVIAAIAYDVGYSSGVRNYTHDNCSYYPFVLVSSQQYWACRIPADQLPSGQ
jgi:hypothetical protein